MIYTTLVSSSLTHNFVFLAKVNQRNVPGIDNAYLAMDTEEGVEVVWNEVMFSERKNFKLQEVRTGFCQSLIGPRGTESPGDVIDVRCICHCRSTTSTI